MQIDIYMAVGELTFYPFYQKKALEWKYSLAELQPQSFVSPKIDASPPSLPDWLPQALRVFSSRSEEFCWWTDQITQGTSFSWSDGKKDKANERKRGWDDEEAVLPFIFGCIMHTWKQACNFIPLDRYVEEGQWRG